MLQCVQNSYQIIHSFIHSCLYYGIVIIIITIIITKGYHYHYRHHVRHCHRLHTSFDTNLIWCSYLHFFLKRDRCPGIGALRYTTCLSVFFLCYKNVSYSTSKGNK